MGQSHQLHAKTEKGNELSVSTHTTDSPLLPVAQLERLQQFRPDLVDFVVEQTRIEADARRKNQIQVNWFIFIEKMAGVTAALAIGLCGLGAGTYAGLQGQPILGGTIVTVTLGTLGVAFLRRRNNDEDNEQEAPEQNTPRKSPPKKQQRNPINQSTE